MIATRWHETTAASDPPRAPTGGDRRRDRAHPPRESATAQGRSKLRRLLLPPPRAVRARPRPALLDLPPRPPRRPRPPAPAGAADAQAARRNGLNRSSSPAPG